MTIKDIMNIGCKGLSPKQKAEEQERRIKVAERFNLLDGKINECRVAVKAMDKGSAEAKKMNGKIRHMRREMDKIKASESVWMREAAWFIYA